MNTLNKRQLVKIRQEEIFRQEVQKDIAKKEKTSVFKFFNQPLGLWVLSTIVVGLVTFEYQNISKQKEQTIETSLKIYQMTREVNFRRAVVDKAVEDYQQFVKKFKKAAPNAQPANLKEYYDLADKAQLMAAAIKLTGNVNLPYTLYQSGGSGFWEMVSISPRYRYSLNNFSLINGFDQTEFKDKSADDLMIQLAIMEGKIDARKVSSSVSSFNEVKKGLTAALVPDETLSNYLSPLYMAANMPGNTTIDSALNGKAVLFYDQLSKWSEGVIDRWGKFRDYNF